MRRGDALVNAQRYGSGLEPTKSPSVVRLIRLMAARTEKATALERLVATICLMRDAYLVSDPATRAAMIEALKPDDPAPDGPS